MVYGLSRRFVTGFGGLFFYRVSEGLLQACGRLVAGLWQYLLLWSCGMWSGSCGVEFLRGPQSTACQNHGRFSGLTYRTAPIF